MQLKNRTIRRYWFDYVNPRGRFPLAEPAFAIALSASRQIGVA